MIRIRPRPTQPMVFDHGAIKAKRDQINALGNNPNNRFKSSDFTSAWGNKTTWYMITETVLAQLNIEGISQDILSKLEALRDQEYIQKQAFSAALQQRLGTSQRRLFSQIEAAAVYSIPRVLWDHQYRKCCYCEKSIDWKRESDVEHFRPKSRVQDDGTHRGYWWLAYDWSNYFLSCKGCNGAKSDKFPLMAGGRTQGPGDLSSEKPVLIHPIDEDPEPYFTIEARANMVKIIGIDQQGRAKHMIEGLTDMNSVPNMMARFALLKELEATALILKQALDENNSAKIEAAKKRVAEQTRQDRPYAAFCRAYFRKENLAAYLAPL